MKKRSPVTFSSLSFPSNLFILISTKINKTQGVTLTGSEANEQPHPEQPE